jgi:zinc protease
MNIKFVFPTLILWIFSICPSPAQNYDFTQKIPIDSSIRIGKLPNGFTYYIKKNKKPENRVELRLAVNAGSILEDTDQLGLAHFTEHMAFNGTKHFAKNEMISYLQTVGVRFGADINAYTGFDATVYMLQIPTDREEIVKKGFQVLEDWANALTFDSIELEKERGVVIEEWRIGRGAEQRMRDKYLPVIFHNSRYAVRLPIGTKENLEKFHRNAITRFYNDWYRPELMAFIAVGDIDADAFEKMIKDHFSKISSKMNPRPRLDYTVPDHKETLISITSDKEASSTSVNIFYMSDEKPEITLGEFREDAKKQLYFGMFNQRISELTRTTKPPFINAYAYFGNIGARGKNAYVSSALVSDTGIISGFKSILRENEKVKKYGFLQSELDRAKKEILISYEKYFNEKDKTESESYAAEFIRNFIDKEPIPGIYFEYDFMKKNLPDITLEEINKLAKEWITDANRVVVVTSPMKDSTALPKENDIKSAIDETVKENIEPYTDKLGSSQLMKEKPIPGRIDSEKIISEIGVTEVVLSNGIKVILKPTDYKNDEILLSAISPGGQFLYPDSDNFSANYAAAIINECGVSDFSYTDLQKLLAGKNVSVAPYINTYTEAIKGNCVPKDMETMFELIYLYFTKPRIDTSAYISFTRRVKAYLKDIYSNPQNYYSNELTHILTQNHPRGGGIPKESDIDKINLARVNQIYRDRFTDASDFTFEIVGNFKTDSIKPFLAQYLGSLPSVNRNETWKDLGIRPPKGNVSKNIYRGTDPKSFVTMVFTDTAKYNQKESYYLKSLTDLLNIRLVEVLREEKSGVYGIRASSAMNRVPYNFYNLTIKFPCAPYNVDSLISEAIGIGKNIQSKGVSKTNLKKIRETQERELELNLKSNKFWLTYLENSEFLHDNLLNILSQKKSIEKLKSKNIQRAARKYFKDQYIKVVLLPASMEK